MKKEDILVDLHLSRAMGKPEDKSLEEWCRENGYTPHPLSIIAEQVTKEVLGNIKGE